MLDFSQASVFFKTTFFFFLGIFGRYVLLCVIFQYFFQVRYKALFAQAQLNTMHRWRHQQWREVGYSLLSSVIFALLGAAMLVAWQQGWTKVYTHWTDYPIAWLPLSLLLLLGLHETYYYWLHRWMHRPKVYRRVHKAHHDSIATSAWTSFSFHPSESLLQSIVLPILLFIVPVHYAVIGLVLVIMATTSVINHLNTEIYPAGFYDHWLGKWCIGATHHSLHHAQFRYNYGLYFTFWDKWMQTESPDFAPLLDRVKRKKTPEGE
ncbi:MAG: sterol desaturase family protein, partial [Saprospiraceae bacterium]